MCICCTAAAVSLPPDVNQTVEAGYSNNLCASGDNIKWVSCGAAIVILIWRLGHPPNSHRFFIMSSSSSEHRQQPSQPVASTSRATVVADFLNELRSAKRRRIIRLEDSDLDETASVVSDVSIAQSVTSAISVPGSVSNSIVEPHQEDVPEVPQVPSASQAQQQPQQPARRFDANSRTYFLTYPQANGLTFEDIIR